MSELLIENRGAVRVITMNRPDKRNALNMALTQMLIDRKVNAYDASKIFDQVKTPIFFDFAHTNERGNRIIADFLFDVLVREAVISSPMVDQPAKVGSHEN